MRSSRMETAGRLPDGETTGSLVPSYGQGFAQPRNGSLGSVPQTFGPGGAGGAAPRNWYPRLLTASVMSRTPLLSESAASKQAGFPAPRNRYPRRFTGSVISTTPFPSTSPRRKVGPVPPGVALTSWDGELAPAGLTARTT